MEIDVLIKVIEASVKKNRADYPLTIGHLLNILKKAKEDIEREDNDFTYEGDFW